IARGQTVQRADSDGLDRRHLSRGVDAGSRDEGMGIGVVNRFLIAALALATVLAGCATHGPDPMHLPVEPFAGHVVTTPTGAWFTPCGADESTRWWVTYVDKAVRQVEEAKAAGLLQQND